jgi:hypothetical protein
MSLRARAGYWRNLPALGREKRTTQLTGTNALNTKEIVLSRQAIISALILSAIAVAVLFNGWTLEQIVLLLVLVVLAGLTDKGNRLIERKLTIANRGDLGAPPFSDVHRVVCWSFGPIFVLSAFLPWVAVGFTVAAILILMKPLAAVFAAAKTGKRIRKQAIDRMKSEKFDVVFYVSGPDESGYQINQWIPVAERMSVKSAICVRRFSLLSEIDETSIPVYFARTAEDLEVVKNIGDAKVFLYPANPRDNATSLRHAEIQHYFINHGESDKIVNQSKLLMAYDKLLVAGPMAKGRLEAAGLPVRDNQVEYVGRPQIEIFLEKVEKPGPIRKILYAPTWEGFVKEANYSSVSEFGLKMLEQVLTNPEIEVVFKPHPFTGSRLASTKAALDAIRSMADKYSNLRVLGHQQKIYPQMNWCDLMIADIGSVVNDFLATGKPVIVTSVKGVPLEALRKEFPTTRGTYIVEDPTEVGGLLAAISEGDPMADIRNEVRTQSLGDFPEGSLARFEHMVKTGINTQQLGVSSATGTE